MALKCIVPQRNSDSFQEPAGEICPGPEAGRRQICAWHLTQARRLTRREPKPNGSAADDCPIGHDRTGRPFAESNGYGANGGSSGGRSVDFDDTNDDFGGTTVDPDGANIGPVPPQPA